MKRIYLFALFVVVLFCSSCVKNTLKVEYTIPEGFNWKMTKSISISVPTDTISDTFDKYATVVKVFSSSDFSERHLISCGAAYMDSPFSTNIYLGIDSYDVLYVELNYPNDSLVRAMYSIKNEVAKEGEILLNKGGTPGKNLIDKDGDGIIAKFDYNDNNPLLSFVSYYPCKEEYASCAFEDSWPDQNIFDMNDAVIDFRLSYFTNNLNKVVDITNTWTLRAAGTSYRLSGAYRIVGLSPDKVSSVTYSDDKTMQNTPVNRDNNGMESGQSSAVFTLFNDIKDIFGSTVTLPLNTGNGTAIKLLKYYSVSILFKEPLEMADLGLDKMDIFIVVSSYYHDPERGKEIHLMQFAPTDLADKSIIKKGDGVQSDENPYVANNGLPWALLFPSRFSYPCEGVNITKAYYNFTQWYLSSGNVFKDWFYLYNEYMNKSLIFF